MKKLERWWENLVEYLDECQTKKIDWNTFDCCFFICECVKAMSNADCYKEFAYKYNTKSMAIKAVKAFASTKSYNQGIVYIVESIGKKLGAIKVDRPQRGDIVVIEGPNKEYICGCVVVGKVAVIDELKGLQYVPIGACDFKTIMRVPE